MKSLPPPFLPHPDEDFDYGLFISDQIGVLIYYWEISLALTELPGEVLKAIIVNSPDADQ
jgi:hypothetical protein